jgi:predicted N-formylglutamate amidohydrolase
MLNDPRPCDMAAKALDDASFAPVQRLAGQLDSGLLLLCDHAANHLPAAYGSLGLMQKDLATHIAYDIGAAEITRRLAARLEAPAVLTCFSRLLIDANRGADDPTLVMRLSDGRIIPANAHIDREEIDARRRLYWQPYRDAIGEMIDSMSAHGPLPAIISIHTFTPLWRGALRPWQVGMLWDSDPRLAQPLSDALAAQGVVVGDNEPYDGALHGDTLYDQVTKRGLAGVLIETRQDLVDTVEKAHAWGDRLADVLKPILACPEMHRIENLASRADGQK